MIRIQPLRFLPITGGRQARRRSPQYAPGGEEDQRREQTGRP